MSLTRNIIRIVKDDPMTLVDCDFLEDLLSTTRVFIQILSPNSHASVFPDSHGSADVSFPKIASSAICCISFDGPPDRSTHADFFFFHGLSVDGPPDRSTHADVFSSMVERERLDTIKFLLANSPFPTG